MTASTSPFLSLRAELEAQAGRLAQQLAACAEFEEAAMKFRAAFARADSPPPGKRAYRRRGAAVETQPCAHCGGPGVRPGRTYCSLVCRNKGNAAKRKTRRAAAAAAANGVAGEAPVAPEAAALPPFPSS